MSELNYSKKINETDFDYIIRLVEGKMNGTYDIDYVELFKLGFGVDLSSTECRKRYYSLKMLIPYIDKAKLNNVSSDSIFSELEKKKIEIEKAKIKLFDQRRGFKKLIRSEARLESTKEFIQMVAEDIKNSKPFEFKPIPVCTSDKEGVLLLSDFHSDLEIDNFLNKFNKEEFLRRFNRIISKTIEHGKFHNIKTLHIAALNDFISGVIHSIIRIQTNENAVSQIMLVSEMLAEAIIELSNNFENIKFYHVLDNHSRVMANLKESNAQESFARFIPWYLKPRLSNVENLEMVENKLDKDDEICIFKVCDRNCGMVHGHLDKVTNVVQNITLMTKTFLEYVFMAHYHHSAEDEVHGCEIIVNPSLAGVDQFSKDHRWSSKPAQKFMVFNFEEGRECTYSIRLDV